LINLSVQYVTNFNHVASATTLLGLDTMKHGYGYGDTGHDIDTDTPTQLIILKNHII